MMHVGDEGTGHLGAGYEQQAPRLSQRKYCRDEGMQESLHPQQWRGHGAEGPQGQVD